MGTASRSVIPLSSVQTLAKRKKIQSPTDEVLQLAGQKLKALGPDDEFEAYGKYISHKLRSLKGNQSIFARKLINDVIFEGEMEALTKDFKVINCAGNVSTGSNFVMSHNYPFNLPQNQSIATFGYQQPSHNQANYPTASNNQSKTPITQSTQNEFDITPLQCNSQNSNNTQPSQNQSETSYASKYFSNCQS